MNAFVRQLAALAALWALCELLLPRRQQMVRLAASLMVMAALVVSLGNLPGRAQSMEWPVFAAARSDEAITGYQRIALTSQANQIEAACLRMARRAGYEAHGAVYLRPDGGVERIELTLRRGEMPPLMEASALVCAMAEWLSLPGECIRWQLLDEEAMP